MDLPTPRALTETLFSALRSGDDSSRCDRPARTTAEDAALALWELYQLHYRDFNGVPEESSGTPSC